MNENRSKRNRILAEQVIKGLNSRNMEGYFAKSREAALAKALEWIPLKSSIGWGIVMTARQKTRFAASSLLQDTQQSREE